MPSCNKPSNRSVTAGFRRPTIELPSAMPVRKVTSMIENAYVELPITAESARVQDTSYIIATNPDTASVTRTSLSAVGFDGLSPWERPAEGRVRVSVSTDASFIPDVHTANNPIATLTVAIIKVVRVLPIPGINTRAAAIVPAAAPNVFNAYRTPTLFST